MARFQIISKDGMSIRYEGKPKYVGTYLKPSYLEFSEISSPTPINWEIGDYVDYPRTGMRYRLYSIPQASKKARKDTYGGAFTYSNVQFFAATKELEIAPFKDLVLNDNGIHFSTSPDVATFENIIGIAERIQACMDDLYPGRWEIKTAMTSVGSELFMQYRTAKDFALSGGTCLDALSKIYELWEEVGWIHSYNSITKKEVINIGYANERTVGNTTDPYLYGKGNGLTAIKKSHTNRDEFATRLYVYGSERNLPTRYYNDKEIANAESVDIRNLMLPIREWGTTDGLPDARKAYLENAEAVAKYGVIPRTHYFDSIDAGADIYPSIEQMTIGKVRTGLAALGEEKFSPSVSIYPNDNERVDEIRSAKNPSDDGVIRRKGLAYDEIKYFATGEEWSSTSVSKGETATTLRSVLLANGQFETNAGKAIFKTNTPIEGYLLDKGDISKATLFLEITDDITKSKTVSEIQQFELEDAVDGARAFSLSPIISATFAKEEPTSIYVQVWIDVEFKNPVASEFNCEYYCKGVTSSIEVQRKLPKSFFVTLKQIGFDISERASQGEKKCISMKSGMCEARAFNILNCTYDSNNDFWRLECARQQDDTLGILFPNSDSPLESGDRFVLLNIAMPELYVLAAMEDVLTEGNKLLAKASRYQYNYEPQIDAKLMAESGRSLREGMYMEIQDEDVVDNGTDYILIDSLNIYEDDSAIPTYKVTLKEKKKVSYKGTPSATAATSTKSAEDTEGSTEVDLSNYATKEYVRNAVAMGGGSGGSTIIVDTEMSDTSINPVQNKVVKKYIDDEVVYLEGHAESVANDAEANAKKYTEGKVRELHWADEEAGETLTEEQKAYNAETFRMFADGLTPIVVLAGLVGSAVGYEDGELGARVELLFRVDVGAALMLVGLYLREDGSVETVDMLFTEKVLSLEKPYSAQTFFENIGLAPELKGIMNSVSEVDVVYYSGGRHYVEYNLRDKRYRVEFNADYTINKTIDITPAGGGDSSEVIRVRGLSTAELLPMSLLELYFPDNEYLQEYLKKTTLTREIANGLLPLMSEAYGEEIAAQFESVFDSFFAINQAAYSKLSQKVAQGEAVSVIVEYSSILIDGGVISSVGSVISGESSGSFVVTVAYDGYIQTIVMMPRMTIFENGSVILDPPTNVVYFNTTGQLTPMEMRQNILALNSNFSLTHYLILSGRPHQYTSLWSTASNNAIGFIDENGISRVLTINDGGTSYITPPFTTSETE